MYSSSLTVSLLALGKFDVGHVFSFSLHRPNTLGFMDYQKCNPPDFFFFLKQCSHLSVSFSCFTLYYRKVIQTFTGALLWILIQKTDQLVIDVE